MTALLEPETLTTQTPPQPQHKAIEAVSIILSKGSLDMVYPALILANGARQSGIEATIFFTFWGLDAVTKSKVENLHVATVGNPSFPMPTLLGGLPGIESFATAMMKRDIDKLDLPTIPELLEILGESGAHLYACKLAMDMFKLRQSDLVEQVEEVITVMDFFDKAAGSQILFI